MKALGPNTVMLLVEDNPADAAFFKEAVEAGRVPADVHVVQHGEEALRFLRAQRPFAGSSRPDVVVLDLNLPVMNGQEMLVRMMSEPDLRSIPVAVLTTSTSDQAVCELCPPGRCLYFAKTDDFSRLQDVIRQIVRHANVESA